MPGQICECCPREIAEGVLVWRRSCGVILAVALIVVALATVTVIREACVQRSKVTVRTSRSGVGPGIEPRDPGLGRP